jgi:hypothetical protein
MTGRYEPEGRNKALSVIEVSNKKKNYTGNKVRFKNLKELVEERVQYIGLLVGNKWQRCTCL